MSRRKNEAIVKEIKPGIYNPGYFSCNQPSSYITVIDASEIFTAGANSQCAQQPTFYKTIYLNNSSLNN